MKFRGGACNFPFFLVLLAQQSTSEEVEPLKFAINPLTEEEQMSHVMPAEFTCDACRAVVHQLSLALGRVRPQDPAILRARSDGKNALRQQAALLTETFENVCKVDTFESYGLKTVEGVKGLHGPGIEKDGAGAIQGGGKWAPRFRAICAELVEERGEDELASLWREGVHFTAANLCADCGKGKETKRRQKRKRSAETSKKRESPTSSSKTNPKRATGLEDLPPPPYACESVTEQNFSAFYTRKAKFKVLIFYDASSSSSRFVTVVELAARILAKSTKRELRKVLCGRADASDGDTFGYPIKSLPHGLFFRKGYKNPKNFNGGRHTPEEFVGWIQNEISNLYMKDDPEEFPRASSERSDNEL